ncbi:MAG TPA: hypothetical protein VN651_01880 [Gemmatimonadaceae bacterium]|nr:hypothetical protein [Gemmatimonadaceae bacterium]
MKILSRPRFAILLAAVAAAAVGCREQTTSARASLTAPRSPSANIVGLSDDWDTFAADVSVQTERRDRSGRLIVGQLPLQYHMERHLRDGKHWDFVLTFSSRARAATAHSSAVIHPEGYEAARFELDGDGSAPRVYDGLGRIISSELPALPPNIAARAAKMQAQLPRALTAIAAATGMAQPTTSDRKWVEGLVLPASGVAARVASLAGTFGHSVRTPDGHDEYTVRHDSIAMTIDVDPSIGAVVSRVERVNGAVRRRWTISYAKAADGTATKSAIRLDAPAVEGANVSRITVTQFNNIHFEKRSGL